MSEEILKLIEENKDLPIYAWVDSDVVSDDCYGRWLGKITGADIQEIAFVEPWGWSDNNIVTKDDEDEYFDYICENAPDTVTEENVEEYARAVIKELDYKKHIVLYVDTP